MPTPVFCCGFECGVLPATLATAGHWFSGAGALATISTSNKRNGDRSLRCTPAGDDRFATTRAMPAGNTYVWGFGVYFATLPNADCDLSWVDTPQLKGAYFKVSDGTIRPGWSSGVAITFGSNGKAVVAGKYYWVDVKVITSANPHTIDVRVSETDGTAPTTLNQLTHAVAADATAYSLGNGNAEYTATGDWHVDDYVISQTSGDYPIGASYVNHFVPTSDGTHTATAGEIAHGTIATPVGTDITAGTTDAFGWINGVPLPGGASDNTRLINHQAVAATHYIECLFGPAPGIVAPTVPPFGVDVIAADREAATATGNFQTKINDNGTENAVVNRGTVAGVVTDRYAAKHYAAGPAGAWTAGAAGASGAGNFNNLRVRFGYSSDATPDQYLRGVMAEAVFPTRIVPRKPIVVAQARQRVAVR